jgi:hypothetical protein
MEARRLDELFGEDAASKDDEITFSGECHDCKRPVVVVVVRKIEEGYEVRGGAVYEPDYGSGRFFLKCDECYQANPELTKFRECEVYSRVVGYLRPVKQWNEGKKAEFALRKTFDKALGV